VTTPLSASGILPPLETVYGIKSTPDTATLDIGGTGVSVSLRVDDGPAFQTSLVVGPVVGRVCATRCVLLVETSVSCTIVCTATPYSAVESAREEAISQEQVCPAFVPTRILLTNLVPDTLYEAVFRLKAQDGSLTNFALPQSASFRTVGGSESNVRDKREERMLLGMACFRCAVTHHGTGDRLKYVSQASASERAGLMGIVLLGGQVDMRTTFQRCLRIALDVLTPIVRLQRVCSGSMSDAGNASSGRISSVCYGACVVGCCCL
jgi:hypothetical protein